jgi:hypothetical protein
VFRGVAQVRHPVLRAAANDAVFVHQAGQVRRAQRHPRPPREVLAEAVQRPRAERVTHVARASLHRLLEQGDVPPGRLAGAPLSGLVGQGRDPLPVEAVDRLAHPRPTPAQQVGDPVRRHTAGGQTDDLSPPDDPRIAPAAGEPPQFAVLFLR